MRQGLTQKGQGRIPCEALQAAMYWAQRTPHGPKVPSAPEKWLKQLQIVHTKVRHSIGESPMATPWNGDPYETIHAITRLVHNSSTLNLRSKTKTHCQDVSSTKGRPQGGKGRRGPAHSEAGSSSSIPC